MVGAARLWMGGLLLSSAVPGAGQDAVAVTAPPVAQPAAGLSDMLVVPALSLVTLQVNDAITSKTAKRGDRFALTMLNEISVDGVVVVPRGSRGEGEVVHAAGTGFGGRPGELLVAARFLMVDGQKLPLQSFRIARAGENNVNTALILAAAGGVIGAVASMFITGTSAEITAGQIAIAKTAQAFSVQRLSTVQVLTKGNTTR
jgi:hypothetical protein